LLPDRADPPAVREYPGARRVFMNRRRPAAFEVEIDPADACAQAANLRRMAGVTPVKKANALADERTLHVEQQAGRDSCGSRRDLGDPARVRRDGVGGVRQPAGAVVVFQQGVGTVKVAHGAQQGGLLHERRIFGGAAFNFPESRPRDRASGDVFSSASGKTYAVLAQAPSSNPFQPGSKKGGLTHLDEYQAYEKRSEHASLAITVSNVVLDAIDANHGLTPQECPGGRECKPIRGIVRFHARAYAESAGGDFFNVGGVAYIEGHEGRWTIEAVTSPDSRRPLWDSSRFSRDFDVDDVGTGSHATALLKKPLTLKVPLSSLRDGELFAVHVSMDAEAIDGRGRESAVEAFIKDPQSIKPALLNTSGLKARGKPRFREPRVKTLAAARCPAGPRPKAGRLQLSAPAYVTDESTGVPMFALVTRAGGTEGAASVTVSTGAGSAKAGGDFKQTRTTVRFSGGDASPRLVEVPILEDQEAEGEQTFTVSLYRARCGSLGASAAPR
jgi:Calx-beta domain